MRSWFRREDKPHGAALHYRDDPSLEEAGLAFASELAEQHGLQVKRGKFVIELVGQGVGKATAVQTLMQIEPFAGSMPVFIGDDVTDEDAFEALRGRGLTIVVADDGSRSTAARYSLRDVQEVSAFLTLLTGLAP